MTFQRKEKVDADEDVRGLQRIEVRGLRGTIAENS